MRISSQLIFTTLFIKVTKLRQNTIVNDGVAILECNKVRFVSKTMFLNLLSPMGMDIQVCEVRVRVFLQIFYVKFVDYCSFVFV